MASKKADTATKMRAIAQAMKQEVAAKAALADLQARKESIERDIKLRESQLEGIALTLDADPELTAVAREIAAAAAAGGEVASKTYSPHYVSTADKQKILERIIADHQKTHPEATSVSYRHIRNELTHRFGVAASTASFFRDQLKEFDTIGGNKNKEIVIKK